MALDPAGCPLHGDGLGAQGSARFRTPCPFARMLFAFPEQLEPTDQEERAGAAPAAHAADFVRVDPRHLRARTRSAWSGC